MCVCVCMFVCISFRACEASCSSCFEGSLEKKEKKYCCRTRKNNRGNEGVVCNILPSEKCFCLNNKMNVLVLLRSFLLRLCVCVMEGCLGFAYVYGISISVCF